MTDREKYKQAFSVLHVSDDFSLEEKRMKKEKRVFRMRPAMAACICVMVLLCSMVTAYAADLGGIREKLHVWIHGQRMEVSVKENEGEAGYTFTVNQDGSAKEFGGGGVSIDDDGNQIKLSAEEVLDQFAVDAEQKEDGSIWFYDHEKSYEITDYFGEDGKCRIAVEENGKKTYYVFEDNGGGGYAMSSGPKPPVGSADQYTTLK